MTMKTEWGINQLSSSLPVIPSLFIWLDSFKYVLLVFAKLSHKVVMCVRPWWMHHRISTVAGPRSSMNRLSMRPTTSELLLKHFICASLSSETLLRYFSTSMCIRDNIDITVKGTHYMPHILRHLVASNLEFPCESSWTTMLPSCCDEAVNDGGFEAQD